MPLTSADRVRIRELWHAHNHTQGLRAKDPQLERVLGRGKVAADALYRAASAVLAEEADDPPCRAARDRAAQALREAALASVRRLVGMVTLRATDAVTGLVIDQAAIDRVEAQVREYLPQGQPSRLALDGPALLLQGALVRDLVSTEPECRAMAENLDGLLTVHREAMARVGQEAEQLANARNALETARTNADRARRAGWHYVQFLKSWDETLELDATFPVSERARTRAPEEALALLDKVGAPEALEGGHPRPGGAIAERDRVAGEGHAGQQDGRSLHEPATLDTP